MADTTEKKASTSVEPPRNLQSLTGFVWDRVQPLSLGKIPPPPPPPPPWQGSLTLFGNPEEILRVARYLEEQGVRF